MDYIKIKEENIEIYRTSLPLGIDKQPLLDEIYTHKRHIFFDREYNDERIGLPGLQLTVDLMTGPAVNNIRKLGYDIAKSIFQSITDKEVYSAMHTSWIYISSPNNPVSKYHDHVTFSMKEPGIFTDYTWIYYIQMPNNCKDKEGHIFFKEHMYIPGDDEGSISFLPEEGYFYMWDSAYAHRPELSPNSTLDRVVIAGNVTFNTTTK